MNDRIREAGQFLKGTVRESARQTLHDHGDDEHRRGFTSAAGISLRRIHARIDALKEQMKGPGLTKAQQAIYAQLDELQSELEADYDRYWQGSGVDWRPLKPVAKGVVIRQTGELQS
ncbi:hypothetical protein JOD57_000021 [Geodermatophilus bullaregiensis]|uniref:hypothetical protein n=1 Tax=Geodermatophilus bullaregiensis TaxID=1564160 RepID=UPI00195B9A98|nr:hypothetical protein [Geodermatophilus bullaregiensis]MBM7804184.1 hypothetical protein [Geodermatophilus bullaregiensis]